MTMRRALAAAFWAVMVALPLVAVGAGLALLPPGTTEIPMQVGFDGGVNRWGAPAELWLFGGLFALINALDALAYRHIDWLFAHGLVHGVSRKGAPVFLILFTVALNAIALGCVGFLLSKV